MVGILSMLSLSAVSQLAHAGEAPREDEVTTPIDAEVSAEVSAAAEVPVEAAAPEASPRVAAPEPRGPRVIWAAPGQAPERPRPSLPVVAPAPTPPGGFGLGNVRWVIGLERASSLAGYRSTAKLEYGSEIVTSGVEASIVGQLDREAATPMLLPRLSLDTKWAGGWSLGAVLSYAARSGKRSTSEADTTLPSSEAALFGLRVGLLKPLSNNIGVWLRGGPTWARRASANSSADSGQLSNIEQRWAISLEPQLVVMPWSHVGLSLGGAFDIGFAGDTTMTWSGPQARERVKETVSTYGMTIGLLALF